jgi:hypothetical protein
VHPSLSHCLSAAEEPHRGEAMWACAQFVVPDEWVLTGGGQVRLLNVKHPIKTHIEC